MLHVLCCALACFEVCARFAQVVSHLSSLSEMKGDTVWLQS